MRNLILLLFMISGITLQGQVDTLIVQDTLPKSNNIKNYDLPEISVISYHNSSPTICSLFTVTVYDYKSELNSLSELLNNHSHISLKNYGPGSLSTISLRGHSASQTDISLDGFSIQSNMNGIYDLSLVPSYFLYHVSVSPSSNSADINGSIGGNLKLTTVEEIRYRKKLQVEYVGSFGSYKDIGNYFSTKGKWGNKNKQYSTFKTFYRSSENNFPYKNLNQIGTPTIRLENADFKQYGFQQNNSFELRDSSFISTKFWYLNNHRKIPPTLTQNSNSAFQNDELINGIISWKKDWSSKFKTEWSNRYMNEHIYYNGSGIVTDSRAHKYESRGQLDYNINNNNHLSTTIGHEYSQANVDDYAFTKPKQNNSYLLLTYDFQKKNISTGIHLKEELTEKKLSPFLFSIYGEYDIKDFRIKANISKNYRRPTFNDLFWKSNSSVGGNPNLFPEEGWKEELNFNYHSPNYRFHTYIGLFNSNINNWILWSPDETGKWTPENVTIVWSRGLETDISYDFEINSDLELKFNTRYNFVKTTNIKIFNNSENTLKKQLIYVPLHSGNISINIKYKHLSFKYNQVFAGKRFITTDNSSSIPKYTISNIQFSYFFKKKKIEIEPVFEIRNLFNTEYQIVTNRPLPPIHFQGIIYFRFNN